MTLLGRVRARWNGRRGGGVRTAHLNSSWMQAAGYDPQRQLMEIAMSGERFYQYGSVEAERFKGLITAESPGRYFNQYIRKGTPYPMRRVKEPQLLTDAQR